MTRPPPPPAAGDLLPPGTLARLGSLELVAATVVRGFVAGLHRSPFLGSGEDFSRHRVYQQGDDVRHLDWRLYGRTDRLHVRLFEESSNLQAMILVDATASMGFAGGGEVTKLRYAQFLAAALAWVMLRSGDAVGLASVGEGTAFHLPPRNRPGHLHDLLLALERLEPAGPDGTGDVAEALDETGAVLRRGGRVVLVSDVLAEDDGARLLGAVGRLRARGDEVVVVRPSTRAELGLEGGEPGRYYDPERPGRATPASPSADPGFAARVEAWYEALGRGLEERGAAWVPMTTDEPPALALASWLARRPGRRA